MSRLEIELTSDRGDGTWTWRAAGAKKPKGDLDGGLLPEGAKVGDVLRVDADIAIDGIEITAVLPPQKVRSEPERLQIIGPPRREGGVTTTLVPKGERRGRSDRGDRGDRGRGRDGDSRGRGDGRGRGERRDRNDRGGDRPDRERKDRNDRDRGDRRERAPRADRGDRGDAKPKAKRLKAGRKHRNAALALLPAEQRPLAEQVLRGGVPGVRQTVERLNEVAKADGRPPIDPEKLVVLSEKLLPQLRGAEWRDRAEAALAQIETVDLGDLRSVVNAADTWARDEETRTLAGELREGLPKRVEKEHHDWLDEITTTLADGRMVRALRLSSRPPKAGSPLPAEVAGRLAEAAAAGLTAETGADRYAAVIDALALSPIHNQVTPQGRPEKTTDQLLATVRRTAKQLPQVAALFGVEPPATAPRSSRPPRPSSKPAGAKKAPVPPPPPVPEATSPVAAVATAEGPAVEVLLDEPPAPEASTVEAPVAAPPAADAVLTAEEAATPVAASATAEGPALEATLAEPPVEDAPAQAPSTEPPAAG